MEVGTLVRLRPGRSILQYATEPGDTGPVGIVISSRHTPDSSDWECVVCWSGGLKLTAADLADLPPERLNKLSWFGHELVRVE